ncbi:right-handed parallel beta-helix repeat-containing protein [Aliikangiella coralliicola]|uniref:Right handed beta helix domain-containing protein n=1 Tax=Aliikangiella coralliicola TaxID=2592383 RepID=A0A545UE51_9GAMM|nr:right-handed parallel beta-helix repeat-containing protein [Aliikangiella coralliicola]TQV87757.1 hypothetical protein FLL46_10245 [Aliikangiella coralliicola]
MSAIDLSREATDFRKHYNSIRMQQGRVLDDQTINEQARIIEEDMRRTRLNTIGVYGSPDDGFLVKDFVIVDAKPTFTLSAGETYLGGLYLSLEQDEAFHLQKDWINFHPVDDWPDAPAEGESRIDMAYLEAWQQPVAAIEDSELFEVALGGPDTSMRVKTMTRVGIRTDVTLDECADAWQEIQADWVADGLINDEMELATDARIQVTYTAPAEPADLCSPGVGGGYLHHENQAIRVQMTSSATFTWGFYNASLLYRARVVTFDGALIRIELLNEPKDAMHWPLQDQTVEIIPWSAALPNGERIAELDGMFAKVSSSYNPEDASFLIDTPVPADFGTQWETRDDVDEFFDGTADERFYYVRIWNRGDDLVSPAEIPIANGQLGNTGLEVNFQSGPLRRNLFWIIAARTGSPNIVVPWELEAVNGALAYGVKNYRAPLALIRWTTIGGVTTGELIHDCRIPYRPLTRIRNCCTYTVGDGTNSHGHFETIQDAINALPPSGGKICLLPGEFDENIVVDKSGVTIEGCGERTRLIAQTSDPAVLIEDVNQIQLKHFAITAHAQGIGVHVTTSQQEQPIISRHLSFKQLILNGATRSAIQVDHAQFVEVVDNLVIMEDVSSDFHSIFITADDVLIEHNQLLVARTIDPVAGIAANQSVSGFASAARGGLHIGGTSERVRIIDNLIQGGISNGITLGSVEDVNRDPNSPFYLIGWIINLNDPCDPCAPGSIYIPPPVIVNGGDGPDYRSRGTIYDLTIERNRILNFGLNGIGVLAFFNLEGTDEFISVSDLLITGNQIENCLIRQLAETPDEMLTSMGYGGISLADVENGVIRENHIIDNGDNYLEPNCGIYLLHGEGVDISDNRILNNGAKTDQAAEGASRGARGGIWIEFATAPKVFVESLEQLYPRQNGVPAVKIHNNIVTQPLGRALSINALGPVSVEGNQLTSQGFVFDSNAPSFLVSSVYIFNLGISNELYLQQLLYSGEEFDDLPVSAPPDDDFYIISQPGLDSRRLFGYLGNGNVMFNDNQVMLDLTDQTGFKIGIMSVGIFTLDDLSFQNNQCDISFDFVLDEIYISQSLMFGWTLRVNGNRFKESMLGALFSAITFGLFGNITSRNQGTHCIRAFNAVASNLIQGPNHVIFDFFNACGDNLFNQGTAGGSSLGGQSTGGGQSVLRLLD